MTLSTALFSSFGISCHHHFVYGICHYHLDCHPRHIRQLHITIFSIGVVRPWSSSASLFSSIDDQHFCRHRQSMITLAIVVIVNLCSPSSSAVDDHRLRHNHQVLTSVAIIINMNCLSSASSLPPYIDDMDCHRQRRSFRLPSASNHHHQHQSQPIIVIVIFVFNL